MTLNLDKKIGQWRAEVSGTVYQDPTANPLDVAVFRDWRCPYCGEYTPPVKFNTSPFGAAPGFWLRPSQHGCAEEITALHNQLLEQQAQQTRDQQVHHERRLQHSGLVGWLKEAKFETFQTGSEHTANEDGLDKVKHYTELLLQGELGANNWLVLVGNYGTGKTHLAAACIHAALDAGRLAYFRVWTQYLKRLQLSWDSGPHSEFEGNIIAELERGWLVALDDVDKCKPTEWAKSTLFSFINHRYNLNLPTLLTFNVRLTDQDRNVPGRLALETALGAAVLDRVLERAWAVIEFNGASHRSKVTWRT